MANDLTPMEALRAPFDATEVEWRADGEPSTYNNKTGVRAVAYVDARTIADRFDQVFGMAGWQCRYSQLGTATICAIGVKFGDEWIWKEDGCGEPQREKDKGRLSDSFKRAAVKWGAARYLYAVPSVFAECETYTKDGKLRFKKFTPAGVERLQKVIRATCAEADEEPTATEPASADDPAIVPPQNDIEGPPADPGSQADWANPIKTYGLTAVDMAELAQVVKDTTGKTGAPATLLKPYLVEALKADVARDNLAQWLRLNASGAEATT